MDEGVNSGAVRKLGGAALSLLFVPVFVVGLFFASKAGIAIADRQSPPGSIASPEDPIIGTTWRIVAAGLPVAPKVETVREFDFRRAGSADGAGVESGVTILDQASLGWELVVLAGGDRRFLPVRFSNGDRQGDELWTIAKDLRLRAVEKSGGGGREGGG